LEVVREALVKDLAFENFTPHPYCGPVASSCYLTPQAPAEGASVKSDQWRSASLPAITPRGVPARFFDLMKEFSAVLGQLLAASMFEAAGGGVLGYGRKSSSFHGRFTSQLDLCNCMTSLWLGLCRTRQFGGRDSFKSVRACGLYVAIVEWSLAIRIRTFH